MSCRVQFRHLCPCCFPRQAVVRRDGYAPVDEDAASDGTGGMLSASRASQEHKDCVRERELAKRAAAVRSLRERRAAAPPPPEPPAYAKDGELEKRGGGVLKSWATRRFAIQGTELLYFSNPKSDKPTKRLDLLQCEGVEHASGDKRFSVVMLARGKDGAEERTIYALGSVVSVWDAAEWVRLIEDRLGARWAAATKIQVRISLLPTMRACAVLPSSTPVATALLLPPPH